MTDSIRTGSKNDTRASDNAQSDYGDAPLIESGLTRSKYQEASEGALEDGDDVSPLLALEPTCAGKPQENITTMEDSNRSPDSAPLLGTSYSQSIENARGSSERRSPESVCYDKLLRENDQSSGGKSRKNVLIERRDCYPPN